MGKSFVSRVKRTQTQPIHGPGNENRSRDILVPNLTVVLSSLRTLLDKISQVSLADLIRVGREYVAPLFDPARSSFAVCCHPSKVDEIREEFGR